MSTLHAEIAARDARELHPGLSAVPRYILDLMRQLNRIENKLDSILDQMALKRASD